MPYGEGVDVDATEGAGEISAETVRVARAAFRKGSLAIRIRGELGSLLIDKQFANLLGKPVCHRVGWCWCCSSWKGSPTAGRRSGAGENRLQVCPRAGTRRSGPRLLGALGVPELSGRGGCRTAGAGRHLADREKNLLVTGGKTRTDSTHVLSDTRTSRDWQVENPTQDPRRSGRNHLPRRWAPRPAKNSPSGPDQGQPPAPAPRHGHQPYPHRRPPHRHTSGSFPHQPLRPAG